MRREPKGWQTGDMFARLSLSFGNEDGLILFGFRAGCSGASRLGERTEVLREFLHGWAQPLAEAVEGHQRGAGFTDVGPRRDLAGDAR
jgi:hypothetical protein